MGGTASSSGKRQEKREEKGKIRGHPLAGVLYHVTSRGDRQEAIFMDLPDIDLEGRVVIMTGSDRGLGRAMSLGLAKNGARLVLASPVMDGLNDR